MFSVVVMLLVGRLCGLWFINRWNIVSWVDWVSVVSVLRVVDLFIFLELWIFKLDVSVEMMKFCWSGVL